MTGRTHTFGIALIAMFGAIVFAAGSRAGAFPEVELKRVPDSGIQPEVAVDRDGTLHLVYFKGGPSHGHLLSAKSKDGLNFTNPIRVNSVDSAAVAVGNIRGARIAVGRRGNVYAVWNASAKLGEPALGRKNHPTRVCSSVVAMFDSVFQFEGKRANWLDH